MSVEQINCDRIRSQIRPFPRVATYPTSWGGKMTFEQIRDSLTPNVNRLMRYYRYVEVDIPDMMAHGFMRLWEKLVEMPDFLMSVDHGGAIKWVMYRSGISHYRKFYRREMYLEELATRSGDPDEFIIDGYEGRYYAGHSDYSRHVDLRVDLERVIRHMAEKYIDSLPHLAALYYITTQVGPDDAAAIAGRSGTKKCWWLTSIVKPMREELADLLGIFRHQPVQWKDKFLAGDEIPLWRLVDQYEANGNERMAATLKSLAAHESCKTLVERLDLPKTTIHMLRRNAHIALKEAYGCSA
jgi:hypothetical protein